MTVLLEVQTGGTHDAVAGIAYAVKPLPKIVDAHLQLLPLPGETVRARVSVVFMELLYYFINPDGEETGKETPGSGR